MATAAPTTEELEIKKGEFLQTMFGQSGGPLKIAEKPVKKKADDPAEGNADGAAAPPPAEGDDAAKAAAAAEAEKAKAEADKKSEKPKRTPKPPAPAAVDQEAIDRAAQAAVDKAAASLQKQTEAASTPPPATEQELTARQTKRLTVLRELAQTDLGDYKSVVEDTKAFWKAEQDYIKKWETENPKQEFDQEAAEHQSFYDEHEPVVDPDDYDEARERIIEKAADTRSEQKVSKLKQEIEFEKRFEREQPEIQKAVYNEMVEFLKQASPELAKMAEKDGKTILTEEVAKQMQESDPVSYEIMDAEVEKMRAVQVEWERIHRFGADRYPVNEGMKVKLSTGEEFSPHAELVKFSKTVESQLASMPAEESERDGKKFMRIGDYNERFRRINALPDNQRASAIRDLDERYWTVGPDDIRTGLTAHYAEIASKKIEKINKLAERKYGKPAQPPKEEPKEHVLTEAEKAALSLTQTRKPATPPSASSSSERTNTSGGNSNGTKLTGEIVSNRMFGV